MKRLSQSGLLGLFAAVLAVSLAVEAQAAALHVPADYARIQDAINAAVSGVHNVLVDDGVYSERITFGGKAIIVASVNGAQNTIIDAQGLGSAVVFSNSEANNSVLNGFTVRGGAATYGGGIYCMGASPTIVDCIIQNNTASYGGGIACNQNASPEIINVMILNNNAQDSGGGIYAEANSMPQITGCVISANVSAGNGGGIVCYHSSSIGIVNSNIVNNTAGGDGGAVCAQWGSYPSITNCTIGNNAAAGNGGALYAAFSSVYNVTSSILWGDSAGGIPNEISLGATGAGASVSYSDIENGWSGTGNINTDPLFAGAGDYHLTALSPCIDAGLPAAYPPDDIDGDLRPQGAGYDMGADEYTEYTVRTAVTIGQLYTEDAAGDWNMAFSSGEAVTINEGITIDGDPGLLYDLQVRYFLTDASGKSSLLGARLYRNYSPGIYYIYLTAEIPPGATVGLAGVRSAALLAQGGNLLDRSTLAGYVNIE